MTPQPPGPDILRRFFANQLADAEHADVRAWLQTMPTDVLSALMDEHWQVIQSGRVLPNIFPETTAADLLARLTDSPVPDRRARPFQILRNDSWRWASVAAASAAVIGLVMSWLWLRNPDSVGKSPITLVQTTDHTQTVWLPDSSVVTLDPHSSLRYERRFAGPIRAVALTGRAFFAVRRDPARPFAVRSASLQTQVLGTSFTVDTRPGGFEEVIVKTGRVAVRAAADTRNVVILTPGDRARFGRKTLALRVFPAQRALATTPAKSGKPDLSRPAIAPRPKTSLTTETNVLAFNQTPLPQVLQTLRSDWHITITLANPALANCRVTARLTNGSRAGVLAQVARSIGVTYRISGSSARLMGTGRPKSISESIDNQP